MSASSRVQHRTLTDILVDQGIVARDVIDEALQIQSTTGETLTAVLVDMGALTTGEMAKVITLQYQLPFVSFRNYDFDAKLLDLFQADFLHQYKILPFDCIGQMLLVAVTEIPPDRVLAEIPRMAKRKVAFYVGDMEEIDRKLAEHRPLGDDSELLRRRRHIHPNATAKPNGSKDTADVFSEQTSEQILEALDSTWASIFDDAERAAKSEPEDDTAE